MAKSKYSHRSRIVDLQPAKIQSIYPGTIIQFKYKGEKVFDKTPMVLVLWNDYEDYKIHGINLNYMREGKIKILFREIMEVSGNILVEEDQADPDDYDDTLPYRNLLKDPYTRLKLPTYKENRGGNPLSKAEAVKQMDMLYEKVIKRFINRGKDYQVYRSYKYKNIHGLKVLNIKLEKI